MFDANIFEAADAIEPSWRGEYEITDAIQWLVDHGRVVRPYVHTGWWIDTGKPIDMIEANAHVLDELTPQIAADAVIAGSHIDAPRHDRGARTDHQQRRPRTTIIGEDAVIENAYVGPFTSLYRGVTLRNCEIERSIVLENSHISDVDTRLYRCLIGREVTIRRYDTKPRSLTLNVGDHSNLSLT